MLTIQDFSGAQGQTFALELGTATVTLTLDRIEPLPRSGMPLAIRDPFSLLFRSSSPVVLPQRLYRLAHPGMGALEIFLVPVARDATGIAYQAIFS